MDKYEYKQKTEQMLELMEDGVYSKAAEIADTIDWRRVRNTTMLTNVSDIYEKSGDYQKSYQVLNIAYHRAEGSRKIIYRLCTLALKTKNVDEAIDYYDDFMQIAPKDPNQYILKYQILRAQRAPVEQQIQALEAFKKAEYIEEWAYELAKLYQEAGMIPECLEECDDLILWFSEGKYVYKAMELKMQYKPLTPSQQEKYDHRFDRLSSETEEMPDLADYKKDAAGKPKPDSGAAAEDAPVTDNTIEYSNAAAAQAAQRLEAEKESTKPEEPRASEQKKIGSTMKLDEALRSLLHVGEKSGENHKEDALQDDSTQELSLEDAQDMEEEDLSDMEGQIEEIESVADLDLARKTAGAASASEKEQVRIPEEPKAPVETKVDRDLEELIPEPEPEEEAEEAPQPEETEKAAEPEEIPAVKPKAAPILPPDIQRLIDEIEGVIPEDETEKAPEPAKKPAMQERTAQDNMGALADELRIEDDDEEYGDYDDELDDDEFEDIPAEEAEEYVEPEAEDAEDYEEIEADDAEEYVEPEADDAEDYEEIEADDAEEYVEPEADDAEDFEEVEAEDAEDYVEPEAEDAEDYEEIEADDAEEYEELDSQDAEDYDVAENLRKEFTPSGMAADEVDDREVPDEEEEMDILSATTPLSRKETAKMIATGKTAPLPVDEISDALSISDTGFIVHGRYDLQSQSGIGTRAGLTEDQKKLFSYFVPVRGMSEQLVDVLEQDRNCTGREGTSRTGNLLIIGNKGNGKTVLAVDVVKAIQKQRKVRQGKVAIVTGESLNKKRISEIFSKLYGGALIIEKAGKMNEKTVARLNKAMERDTGELLVVLEDQRKPLDRLLSSNREFRRKFTSRLEVPILINDELVTFGQTYAQENGYRIDEMGILALYSRIDALQREDHAVTIAEVKEVMDEAMAHSQKASAKKLVKRVFGKNTDDADRIILSERDFNI